MTRDTSSASAKDTQKTEDVLVANGIPRESIDPLYVSTYEDMAEARKATEVRWGDLHYAVWVTTGKLKHLFGIHTLVPLEEWDLEKGSMRIVGDACWHCQKIWK